MNDSYQLMVVVKAKDVEHVMESLPDNVHWNGRQVLGTDMLTLFFEVKDDPDAEIIDKLRPIVRSVWVRL